VVDAAESALVNVNLLLKNVRLPLADFSLEVDVTVGARVTAIFGPSGAGKTSLLDVVAGLRRPSSALVQLGERVLTDTTNGIFIPPRHRRIGYVPQDLALFPHLSVRQNLLYGCKQPAASSGLFGLDHVSRVLEISGLSSRQIGDLSGGEKQRVALARALLSSPELLLLDEPLASVDGPLKARITEYLVRVRDEFPISMLYVTHDQQEALAIAEEIVVLSSGKVVEAGPLPAVLRAKT
jgi:molybdate transport system ATP-binding protein